MSNIYIQEPPTFGKVLLKTTVGDIDLELWSKEAPKACRNFIQLCLEGYYNGTIFHRVVKDFIVQGGDPTGTGEGGESIYGHPFKDEFHSRLRFCRRGLVAMANAGKDDNASQFFFTMGPCQELQNKHTVFGKVTGETVFNMLRLQEGVVDQNERPAYPQKILKTTVLDNPFPDIVPRKLDQKDRDDKKKKNKKSGVKDFKLLSFGEEAEEDEEETVRENKKYTGKSKSTHDLLDDPRLSSVPAVEQSKKGKKKKEKSESEESDLSEDEKIPEKIAKIDDEQIGDELEKVKNKLKGSNTTKKSESKKNVKERTAEEEEVEEYSYGQEKREERKRQAEAIRKEFKELKKSMKKDDKNEEVIDDDPDAGKSDTYKEYKKDKEEYESKKKTLPTKGTDRESFTMALLAKFQKKLQKVKESAGAGDDDDDEDKEEEFVQDEPLEDDSDLGKDGGAWMAKKLRFEQKAAVLAKDASTKDDKGQEWFAIDDPRNPINQRRRQIPQSTSRSKR